MSFDPQNHHRRSIRLQKCNYADNGAYFITICTQNKVPYLGKIVNREMILNDAGMMVQLVWNEIPQFYKGIGIDTFQIMPDHIHGIIIIKNDPIFTVGAGPRACPNSFK